MEFFVVTIFIFKNVNDDYSYTHKRTHMGSVPPIEYLKRVHLAMTRILRVPDVLRGIRVALRRCVKKLGAAIESVLATWDRVPDEHEPVSLSSEILAADRCFSNFFQTVHDFGLVGRLVDEIAAVRDEYHDRVYVPLVVVVQNRNSITQRMTSQSVLDVSHFGELR